LTFFCLSFRGTFFPLLPLVVHFPFFFEDRVCFPSKPPLPPPRSVLLQRNYIISSRRTSWFETSISSFHHVPSLPPNRFSPTFFSLPPLRFSPLPPFLLHRFFPPLFPLELQFFLQGLPILSPDHRCVMIWLPSPIAPVVLPSPFLLSDRTSQPCGSPRFCKVMICSLSHGGSVLSPSSGLGQWKLADFRAVLVFFL